MVTQEISLNLIPGQILPRINVTQYDYGSRLLQFPIYDGTQRFILTSGITALINGTKSDKHGFEYSATVDVENNVVVANLTQQMTAAAGETVCEIVLETSGKRIGTLNFVLMVQKAALNEETDVSGSDFPDIIAGATAQMENAARSATEAATSASAASTSASSAAQSASNASNSASAAATSETNAASSAANAAQSASDAKALAINLPYIGQNGNWYVYNTTTHEYQDSGVDASITVDIADITMLEPDATPRVTNSGTNTDAVFHLFIPRGKGISSIEKTSTSGLVDTYTITFSDGLTTTFDVTNGEKGDKGDKGDNGTNGKSAYQIAVDNGYSGTESEWLASLKGDDGELEYIYFEIDENGHLISYVDNSDDLTFAMDNGRLEVILSA